MKVRLIISISITEPPNKNLKIPKKNITNNPPKTNKNKTISKQKAETKGKDEAELEPGLLQSSAQLERQ